MKEQKMKKSKNFSLIELLAVIVIVGILAWMIIGNIGDFTKQAEDAVQAHDVALIERQLENFRAANGRYPSTFHCGYQELNATTPAPQLPAGILANYTSAAVNCDSPGNYAAYADGKFTYGIKNIGTHTTGTGLCGQALQKAGITRIFYGTVDSATSIASNNFVMMNGTNANTVRLLHANNFYKTSAETPSYLNEVKIKGRSLREWYGKPYKSYEAITCVIPLYITTNFAWKAYDDNGNILPTTIAPSTSFKEKDGIFQYVCFFICDMTPGLGGLEFQKNPRPAELLGVVPCSEFAK